MSEPPSAPVGPALSASRALIFYGVLLGAALGWGALRGDLNVFVYERDDGEPRPDLLLRVALGIGVGLFFVATTRLASRLPWSKRLGAEFRKLLGPLTLFEVTILAITSAVGEEALFRGAMQPQLGFLWTTLIFGLLHMGPGKAFWPWTLWALVCGGALGFVADYTGDLLAPTIAHFTVNYFNLWQISRGELG